MLGFLEMLARIGQLDSTGWEVEHCVVVSLWVVLTTATAWWAVHGPSGW